MFEQLRKPYLKTWKYSCFFALLSLVPFGLVVAYNFAFSSCPAPDFAAPPGDVTCGRLECDKPSSIKFTMEVYPDVIYYGDQVYIAIYAENTSETETMISSQLYRFFNEPLNFSLTSAQIPGQARWVYESPSCAVYMRCPRYVTIPARERRLWGRCVLEFPALEDMNAPFWKDLQRQIQTEPTFCKLNLTASFFDTSEHPIDKTTMRPIKPVLSSPKLTGNANLLVRPRPNNEETTISEWFDKTDAQNLFPILRGNRKSPCDPNGLSASRKSYISFNATSYDPWLFVRVGNRKPSDPNNPTTVDGWRKLEAEFAPSTLRDEITLTRLQLEYYDAGKGDASEAALKTLVDWLSQRPEPQRVVLSQSLLSKRAKFQETPLEAKNATLCDALTSIFPDETLKSDDAK